MNLVGEEIESKTLKCRTFSAQDFLGLLRMRLVWFLSWRCDGFAVDDKEETRLLRFEVKGTHHKGHVYVFLNGSDLYDIFLTTTDGLIVHRTDQRGLSVQEVNMWLDVRIGNGENR